MSPPKVGKSVGKYTLPLELHALSQKVLFFIEFPFKIDI